MRLGLLQDLTGLVISRSLDAAATRHRVIADNIANAETPGFTRSEVRFEDSLKDLLAAHDPKTIEKRLKAIQPTVVQDTISSASPEGNNVAIDREMADITKNLLQYESLVRLRTMKGSMLMTAITEGKR